MTSIPDNPRDQLLFFIDNPLVATERGGGAIIEGYRALLDALLGDGASSAKTSLFSDDWSVSSAPLEATASNTASHGDDGNSARHDATAVVTALQLLGGLAKGEIDI